MSQADVVTATERAARDESQERRAGIHKALRGIAMGDKCVERVLERSISAAGRELGQYVRDLYASGARLWTKEMFRDIEAELAKEPKPVAVMILSMNGAFTRMKVPVVKPESQRDVSIRFQKYQDVVFEAEGEEFVCYTDKNSNGANMSDNDKRAAACVALSLVQSHLDSPLASSHKLQTAWEEARHNWSQSGVCSELIAILGAQAHIPNATKIVCFGLGNLEGSSSVHGLDGISSCDGLPHRGAMTQHAAALTMATVLGERFGSGPLAVLAQDPAYTSLEKPLLENAGIKVVDGYGSLAFTHVDANTIVFSCHPNIPVKQIVADIARPAAMIWNRVKAAEEEKSEWVIREKDGYELHVSPWSTDEDSPRTRTLIEGYHRLDFPTERDRFGDLEIYIRRD